MNAFEDMGTDDKSERELLVEIRSDVKHLRASHEELKSDHESRLRDIERGAWKQSGAFGVVGVIVSAVIAWIVAVLSGGRH